MVMVMVMVTVSRNEQRHTSGVKPQLLPLEHHQWSDSQAIAKSNTLSKLKSKREKYLRLACWSVPDSPEAFPHLKEIQNDPHFTAAFQSDDAGMTE